MTNLKKLENMKQDGFDSFYEFLDENQSIGIGAISKNADNQLYIFIKKDLRGNGFGKILFSKMVEEAKNQGFTKLNFAFLRKNTKILKTVVDNGGLHLSTNGEIVKYFLPLS